MGWCCWLFGGCLQLLLPTAAWEFHFVMSRAMIPAACGKMADQSHLYRWCLVLARVNFCIKIYIVYPSSQREACFCSNSQYNYKMLFKRVIIWTQLKKVCFEITKNCRILFCVFTCSCTLWPTLVLFVF